ncbi:MAG: FtsX-like permease family protein [Actinobacteria bacterium]|nr:MAG: FtsX-like permease family protein [Actinomycetota bacterium]
MTPRLRRIAYPLRLAWIRLSRRGERVVLVALGIAAGAALLASVLAGSLIAQDKSLSRATSQVPQADRVVRLVWGGIGTGAGNDPVALDKFARTSITPLAGRPVRAMLFRQSESNGHLFDLGAIDGLARFVHLDSGRLPRTCSPERCEVVQLGGSGPIPKIGGLNLVRVGRATLASALPLGDLITRETYASILSEALRYHTAPTPPLLLAEGVDGLTHADVFGSTYRSYAWTAPLGPHDVHPWTVNRFAGQIERTRSQVEAESLAFDLTAPVDELRAANSIGDVAGRRLLLIGGEAAALLLAFSVLAATGLRRDAEAEWRRLTWYGARRWQLALVSTAEVVVVSLLGAAVGWAVGTGIGALVAGRADVPVGAILDHSTLAARGVLFAVVIAAAASLVVLLSLRLGSARLGGWTVTPVDAAAAGALVAVVIALARGAADASALASERGTGGVLLVLPALIVFVAAVLFARVLAPALGLLERWGRRGAAPVRLAALSLARHPGRAAVAVGFLVVSLGLALFAEAYRATLVRGQNDQASFAAPVDDVVSEDLLKLVPVFRAASLHDFGDAVPATHAFSVLRQSADVPHLEGAQGGVTVLALPARDLTSLRWRSDDSSASPKDLQRLLQPAGPVTVQGVRIPAEARVLTLPLRAHGDELAVRAVILHEGRAYGVPLGTTTDSRRLAALIPAGARGGLLLSFTFDLTGTGLHGIANGGGNVVTYAVGTMRIGAPRADGRRLPFDFAAWTGTGGITPVGGGGFRYFVTNSAAARFRARQPTDGRPVPVVVTPTLANAAGPGGILPIAVGNGTITARVVAEARRVPTIDGNAVLADLPTISAALDADAPGAGAPAEAWLVAPRGKAAALDAALARPPFDVLTVTSRRHLLSQLRSEPLARGTMLTLIGAALAALGLALVGLLLGVVADVRDERGELFDLEAQGAEPSTLRAQLRLRSGFVAGFGLVGGIVTGAILAILIVALVTLTAGAISPQPPLLLGVDWPVLLLGFVAYAALAAVVVGVATRRAFRSDVAGRFAEAGT